MQTTRVTTRAEHGDCRGFDGLCRTRLSVARQTDAEYVGFAIRLRYTSEDVQKYEAGIDVDKRMKVEGK